MTPNLESLTVTLDTGKALAAAGWDRPTVFVWEWWSGTSNSRPIQPRLAKGGPMNPDADKDYYRVPAPTLSELIAALTEDICLLIMWAPTDENGMVDPAPLHNILTADNPTEAAAALWLAVRDAAPDA